MKRTALLWLCLGLCLLTACGCSTLPENTPTGTTSSDTAPSAEVTATPVTPAPDTEEDTCALSDSSPETDTETEPTPETEVHTEEETAMSYTLIRNPIVSTANDPWVVEHGGRYYYCASFNGRSSGVTVAEISAPHALGEAKGTTVYTAPEGTAYSAEYWAPELHYIDGAWYIYVAASDGNNENHRMYVLKGRTQDPTDPFEMVGQITDPTDRWAIDGTVLSVGGELYFVWSGWKGAVNVAQNLYIAHMSDPVTVDSERVLISSPIHAWERVGNPYVNEGPAALYRGEDTFLVYSASGSWTDSYCLGLLRLVGDDPMNPDAWEKSAEPVFSSHPGVAYGPGHCSFTTSPDGCVWMVYHANRESGTGWSGRSGWMAPVTFASDGTPVFGKGYPERGFRYPDVIETTP